MEPVVSTIFKVLQEIAKAERAARRNRARCRDLARRAPVVSSVLRDALAGASGDTAATRSIILCGLREALDEALKLVESCARRGRLSGLLDSRARAARFGDVDKRINNCLAELSAASGASIEKKIDRLANTPAKDGNARPLPPSLAHAGVPFCPDGSGNAGGYRVVCVVEERPSPCFLM